MVFILILVFFERIAIESTTDTNTKRDMCMHRDTEGNKKLTRLGVPSRSRRPASSAVAECEVFGRLAARLEYCACEWLLLILLHSH